jgi:hypothetical protein
MAQSLWAEIVWHRLKGAEFLCIRQRRVYVFRNYIIQLLTSEVYDLTCSYFQWKQFARCDVLHWHYWGFKSFWGWCCVWLSGSHSVPPCQWVGTIRWHCVNEWVGTIQWRYVSEWASGNHLVTQCHIPVGLFRNSLMLIKWISCSLQIILRHDSYMLRNKNIHV